VSLERLDTVAIDMEEGTLHVDDVFVNRPDICELVLEWGSVPRSVEAVISWSDCRELVEAAEDIAEEDEEESEDGKVLWRKILSGKRWAVEEDWDEK
jgi:hypothetical protein